MAEATLNDVVKILERNNNLLDDMANPKKDRVSGLKGLLSSDEKRDKATKSAFVSGSPTIKKTQGSGKALGIGAGIGAMAAGMLKSAAGLAAMGVAIPAFFGGLLVGSGGLDWMQSTLGMNYDGLKNAALGFSDIILAMDPQAFIVLGGIMGISALGGVRGAKGLGAMGFAISAFFGGLLAGEAVYAGFSALGGDLNFANTKKVVTGFTSIFEGMTPEDLIPLGAILGGAAVLSAFTGGTKAAKGLGAMGLGITAFFGGLLAGEALYAAAGNIVDLDFGATKTVLAGFSDSIGALSKDAVIALGALMAGGALVGVSKLKAKSLARGLFAIGGGIIAIMGGMAIIEGGATLAEAAGVDFGAAAGLFKGFSDSVGQLSDGAVKTLLALVGAGGALGLISSDKMKKDFILGAGTLAGSIGAFFAVFAGVGAGASALGVDGSKIKTLVGNFGEAIDSLSPASMKTLATMVGAGAALGALTAATGGAGAMVFAGIPALGASIGAFLVAIDGVALVGGMLGADGSNTKKLLKNFGDGIDSIAGVDFTNAMAAGAGMKSLAGGIAAFFAVEAMGAVGEVFGGAKDAIIGGWNWLTGRDDGTKTKGGPIQMMIDAIKPLQNIDQKLYDSMDKFGTAMAKLGQSFASISGISTKAASANLSGMLLDMGGVLDMMDTLVKGGTYDTKKGGFLRASRYVDFGPGLDNIDMSQVATMAEGFAAIKGALNGTTIDSAALDNSEMSSTEGTRQSLIKSAIVETMIVKNMLSSAQGNASGTTVSNQDNSTQTTNTTNLAATSGQVQDPFYGPQ